MDHRTTTCAAVLLTLTLGCVGPTEVEAETADGEEIPSVAVAVATANVEQVADGLEPTGDSDADGLCDSTELGRGTDPHAADTDGDGIWDQAELALGFDPRTGASPGLEGIIRLDESSTAVAIVPHVVVVTGRGEDYTGAFDAPVESEPGSESAASFWHSSRAIAAQPEYQVAIVESEEERFRGVLGLTELHFESAFSFGELEPRGCKRAFTFRYNVKRSDGVSVSTQTYVLLVGEDAARWCEPPSTCL